MNGIKPIVMDREAARVEYEAYDKAIKKADEKRVPTPASAIAIYDANGNKAGTVNNQRRLDEGLRATYKALSEGETVINIQRAFHDIGCDRQSRPKIALARADWRSVSITRDRDGSFSLADANRTFTYDFPANTLSHCRERFTASAIVPLIPALLRPDNLPGFVIAFEAVWVGEMPPRVVDPLLLRPLGGVLYSVIAEWDLSEIESLILNAL